MIVHYFESLIFSAQKQAQQKSPLVPWRDYMSKIEINNFTWCTCTYEHKWISFNLLKYKTLNPEYCYSET